MAPTLAALSFTCFLLIAALAAPARVRTCIPHLALALWLAALNLVHGVNAVLWAGNINIHIPVWCDITTKLMLGTTLALPAALLCIAMELRLVASDRKLSTNRIVLRNRKLLEVFLCYVLPVIYMSLHLLVQDSRFDIVRDLGCSAATHPSTLGFLVMWIPPVLVSALVFVFCAMSFHNAKQPLLVRFSAHIESRAAMTAAIFFRRLTTCIVVTAALCILSFSALFSVPEYKPWRSFASVHANMGVISIVQPEVNPDEMEPHDDLRNIQVAWWGMFIISVLYIVLSLAIGEEARDEEARDAYRWVRARAAEVTLPKVTLPKKKPALPRGLTLPVYNINLSTTSSSSPDLTSSSPASIKSHTLPLTAELRSGWDDTLTEKTPRRLELLRSPRAQASPERQQPSPTTPPRARSPVARPRSASMRSVSSAASSMPDDDRAFMASTMLYLGSPTAHALGLAALPARAAAPSPSTPRPAAAAAQPKPKPAPRHVPEDVEPPLAAVLNAAWPLPPTSPTPSVASSVHYARSRSHSPASSAEEGTGVGYHLPAPAPAARATSPLYARAHAHAHGRPFEAAGGAALAGLPPSPSPVGKGGAVRTLGTRWSRERLRQAAAPRPLEGIQMTVVHETA